MGSENSTYRIPAPFKQKERRGNNRNQRSFLNWIDQLGQVKPPGLSKAIKTADKCSIYSIKMCFT